MTTFYKRLAHGISRKVSVRLLQEVRKEAVFGWICDAEPHLTIICAMLDQGGCGYNNFEIRICLCCKTERVTYRRDGLLSE